MSAVACEGWMLGVVLWTPKLSITPRERADAGARRRARRSDPFAIPMVAIFRILLLLLAGVAVASASRVPLGRRAVIGGVAGAACIACSPARPAAATLAADLSAAERELLAAGSTDEIAGSLEKLLGVVEDFGGVPTQELTETLVKAMRTKRSGAGEAWNGITEEAYNRLMRSVDPWRVTELRGPLQTAIYSFPFVYAGLLAVQQFVPKFFQVAYGVGAALVLGPLLFQIIVG